MSGLGFGHFAYHYYIFSSLPYIYEYSSFRDFKLDRCKYIWWEEHMFNIYESFAVVS